MTQSTPRLTVVGAARPNLVKIAPLLRAFDGKLRYELVHTGQHYDWAMSGSFFEDLGIPDPDVNLEVGSGSHAEQTAGVLIAFERHLQASHPDAVVVVGDVNSTLACALAASKMGIPVAHVEAGLRSRDWSMPEEINRVLTDRLSTWLFTPSRDADENLISEGISEERIHFVGNVMIDSLFGVLPAARRRFESLSELFDLPTRYAVLTLHRPSNVDDDSLFALLECLEGIGDDLSILFPVHPRTAGRLRQTPLGGAITAIEPLPYRDFVSVIERASMIFTDSGGIQEEASILGVPCLTLRDTTERPITCELGTNQVVGSDPAVIKRAARLALEKEWTPAQIPLWDGNTAPRIAEVLVEALTP